MVKYFSNILYMTLVNSYNYNMHRVPTYAEIIEEAIIHPVDKIKLPDRQALFIRNLPQMTRFDEVDDPADIGKEQEQIQETKLRELTLQHLQPGMTLSIARAKDNQLKKRQDGSYPPGGYPPGPPPPPQAGMMRRLTGTIATGAGHVANGVGNAIQCGMQAYDNHAANRAERAAEYATYLENQQWAMDNEDKNIKARAEQEDQERMSWFSSHSNAAESQSSASLNGPASTVYHYVGDDSDEPAASSGGASSSGGGFSAGSAAVDAAHQAAKDKAEEKRKANIKGQSYQINTMGSGHRGPDPGGGGGGYGKYLNERNARALARNVASNLFL
jgi:hypothetical protein